MRAAIALLLAVEFIAHSGQVLDINPYRADDPLGPPAQGSVLVKNCSGNLESIYADSRLTQPLPNPFRTDKAGTYTYFSTSIQDQVILTADYSRWYARVSSCQNRRKK
jgi:hypothetical protein